MDDLIQFPSAEYKGYIDYIVEYCRNRKLSLILKGSLAKGSATRISDIDLIVLGLNTNNNIRDLIYNYDIPVMLNLTEKPPGILILIYKNGICLDLDIRRTITDKDLVDSKILLKYEENFIIGNDVIREKIPPEMLPHREQWYKILRLVHRGTIKYLSNKIIEAEGILIEIKNSLTSIEINNINYSNTFKDDMAKIFDSICSKYPVNRKIQLLFRTLFREIK